MTVLMEEDMIPPRKYSPRKMETAREKTSEISRARNEVRSVPYQEGERPELSGHRVPYHADEEAKPVMFHGRARCNKEGDKDSRK